jgi:hypothetical protein
MINNDKNSLEEYKFNLISSKLNDIRLLYFYKNVENLGFSWSAFKRFANIIENKYPGINVLCFSSIRSFFVWANSEDIAYKYYKIFDKEIKEYMKSWCELNNRIKYMSLENQRKYRRVIRRFRRYGKLFDF